MGNWGYDLTYRGPITPFITGFPGPTLCIKKETSIPIHGAFTDEDRFISKMFLRGDSVILVLRNPKSLGWRDGWTSGLYPGHVRGAPNGMKMWVRLL